jgi:hypothetical protein
MTLSENNTSNIEVFASAYDEAKREWWQVKKKGSAPIRNMGLQALLTRRQ